MNPALKSPRKPADLPESLHQRLNVYALAATATGVTLIASPYVAEGKVVYTKTHRVMPRQLDHFFHLDLNHDGIPDFKLGIEYRYPGYGVGLFAIPFSATDSNSVRSTLNNDWAAAYPAGVRIGPRKYRPKSPKGGSNYGALMEHGCVTSNSSICEKSGTFGNWVDVKKRYLGLVFLIKGETHYGWARLDASIGTRDNIRAVLTGYAYETIPNKPIITGKTQGRDVITVQPGSLGHLARGAFGNQAARSKENP